MAGSRYRLMIVDDEEDMRTLLTMSLGEKYEVFTATNGLDAMLKLPKYEPDLVLLDIMMPLMGGHEVAKKIRVTPGYEDMPIIMLSALNSTDDIKQGYDSGANLYLTKPFQPERVLRNVAMSLDGLPVRAKKVSIADIEDAERRHAEKVRRALEKKEQPPAAGSATPAAPRPPAPPRPAASSSGPKVHPTSTARPRILLVDDDEDFRFVARTALEEEFEIVVVDDGFDAIARVPEVEPDIFIIDGMMPRMSGYQLIDILRGSVGTAFKPILFVSARCTERDRRTLAAKGVDHYLEKPFSPEKLLAKIRVLTSSDNFIISPKKKNIRDILYEEGHRRAAAKEVGDRRKRWDSGREIKQFLADELKGKKK